MARSRSIHIDDSQLDDLQRDMDRSTVRVRINSREGLGDAAEAVDRQMVIDWKGHKGSYFTPRNRFATPQHFIISHEMVGPLAAEIGVEHRGAGKLAHIFAYGAPAHPRIGNSPATPGSAPVVDPGAAPRRALAEIDAIFGDVVEESPLGKGGGR